MSLQSIVQSSMQQIQDECCSSLDACNMSSIVEEYVDDIRPSVMNLILNMFFQQFQRRVFVSLDHSRLGVINEREDNVMDYFQQRLNEFDIVLTKFEAIILQQLFHQSCIYKEDAPSFFEQFEQYNLAGTIDNQDDGLHEEDRLSTQEKTNRLRSFLNLRFSLPIRLSKNPAYINQDRRSQEARNHVLETTDTVASFQGLIIDKTASPYYDDLSFEPHVLLNHSFTFLDLLVVFMRLKGSKFDRWYEMYCNVTHRKAQDDLVSSEEVPEFQVHFDHGS